MFSLPHLSRFVHSEWKVLGRSLLVTASPSSSCSRCSSSPAALRVKVMTSSDSGASPDAMRWATRAATTRVLPLPGPAAVQQAGASLSLGKQFQ
jgi:hypothetical protein